MKVNLDDVRLPLTVCLFDLRLLARFKLRTGSITMEEIVCPNFFWEENKERAKTRIKRARWERIKTCVTDLA